MENKQQLELYFWKHLISETNFEEFREKEDSWKIDTFPCLRGRLGRGLDVGCGPVSVFEKTSNYITAIDPLMDEYRKLISIDSKIKYLNASGENIPFENDSFDYSYCCNVIDHTPNPEKMVEEMKRVTKNKIFFQVNFDRDLSPCHYSLWNRDKVIEMFHVEPVWENINKGTQQDLYWAIFQL